MTESDIKKAIREKYASIALGRSSCCCESSCCDMGTGEINTIAPNQAGYSENEIAKAPSGSFLGLGCGNPLALLSLKEGETVLDLGSGAGFDCFLAAMRVGENGRVIGVDMTPEMIEKARENAQKGRYPNVEFRLGEIENLPLSDNSVDVVISNCVINLSTNKPRVFREAFRVLKPGGRIMVSDIVLQHELPEEIKNSIEAYTGCIAGASLKEDYLKMIVEAGFSDVKIVEETVYPFKDITSEQVSCETGEKVKIADKETEEADSSVLSVKISAWKS